MAIGTVEGNIVIYDSETGNLWKKIEAHKKEISALCFDITGNIIVSYSGAENLVKCFKIGVTNFFGFFSGKPSKSFKLGEIKNAKSMKYEEKLNRVKLICNLKKNKEIMLTREDGSMTTLNL
jgi:WD40 repeat protein